MRNNLKLWSSSIILFTISYLCLFSASAWSCPQPPPVAILEISPDPALVGQTVLLDGSDSIANCGSINLYQWDFTNNGTCDYYETPTYHPDGAFDGKTTYVYSSKKTYTATLLVRNSCNGSDTDTDTVVVNNPIPVAILNISPDPVLKGQTALLDGSNSTPVGGDITQYAWDFTNDGVFDYYETSTYCPDGAFDGKTTHIYTDTGTFAARLNVTNSYNYTGTNTDTVVVCDGISYIYDQVGNRVSMTDASGTTSYSYDYLGRLITVTNPDNKTISYQYDANGNRTQLTDSNGNVTTYAYDNNNQLTQVNATAGSTTYQYDSLGNPTRADLPNGTYTQYSYHPTRNWLVSLVNKKSDGSVLSSYSYTYDNVGNRQSVTENGGSAVSYGYDDIYQLTSETRTGTNPYTITYQYDPAGNRTQMIKNSVPTNYTYNTKNQLLTETTGGTVTTYAYDANGNQVSKTTGGSTTTYAWDWNNRLLAVSASGNSTAYAYDGDGNRINKTQNSVNTKYINDVALSLVQVLQETDNAGTIQASYTYGQGLISMNKAGVNVFYHTDGLGSTRQLTNSAGALAASYTYDSFGNVISQYAGGNMASILVEEKRAVNKAEISLFAFLVLGVSIVSIRNRRQGVIILLIISLLVAEIPRATAVQTDVTGNPSGFTGEQQFGEADDLVFLRHRYYSPSIGRFISRDPILSPLQLGDNFVWFVPYLTGNPQLMNAYVYCGNNPVNHKDPEGLLHPIAIWFLVILAIVGAALTIRCLIRIHDAMEEANRVRRNQPPDECGDTQGRWNRLRDLVRLVIDACGTGNYVG